MQKKKVFNHIFESEKATDRWMKKSELKTKVKISPGTYTKLDRDQFVSMDVIARICCVLDYGVKISWQWFQVIV